MAIGIYKLNRGQRCTLSLIFITFNIVQVVIGLILIAMATFIGLDVAPVLHSERSEVTYVFATVGWAGSSIMLNYLFGIWLCKIILKHPHKKSTRIILVAWTYLSFYVILFIILIAAMARKIYKHIIRTMKHSFRNGMTNYLKNPIWKVTIDRIQLDNECCGVKNFKEWHNTEWLDRKYQVNIKSDLIKEMDGVNGQSTAKEYGPLPVIPWSCCRRNFPMQCFHDPLQQVHATNLWLDKPSLVEESVNQNGCIDSLRLPLQIAIMVFLALAIVTVLLQIAIFLTSRILYTSCRNALLLSQQGLLDQKTGTAPGWIFGRGDCGYNRGKTVVQIMAYDDNGGKRRLESTTSATSSR